MIEALGIYYVIIERTCSYFKAHAYLTILCFIQLLVSINTASASDIYIASDFEKVNTSSYAYIYKDSTNKLRIEDFLISEEKYNFSQNQYQLIKNKRRPGSQFWIRIKIINESNQTQDLRLVARSDALHYTFYETHENELLSTSVSGMNIPALLKPLQHHSVAFPIHLPALGTRTLYLTCDNDHIATEIFQLESLDYYDRSILESGLILGSLFAFLFLAAIVSVILFLITRKKINLYYSLYAVSNAITFFIASRILQFSILPSIATGHIPQFVGVLITSILFLRFIQEYYSSQSRLYKRRIIFLTYSIVMGCFILLILFHSHLEPYVVVHPMWERIPMILLSIMCMYCLTLIVQFAIKNPSWNNTLFLVAFFGIIFSSVIAVLLRNGIIQDNFLTNYSYAIALVLEFAILSIVLVYDLVKAHSLRAILETQLLNQEKELEQAHILKTTIKEKDTLLREIHHRVKNNLQVISALLTLQSKHVKDDRAVEALKEGQGRVQSMALIHQDLYQHDNLKGVNTKDYFEKLIENLVHTYQTDHRNITVECDIQPLMLDVDTMIPIGLVVNELTSNALKHAFEGRANGCISLSLHEVNNQLKLQVIDDGHGVDPSQLENKSFGFSLIRSFARRLDADLNIINREGLQVELLINNYQKAY